MRRQGGCDGVDTLVLSAVLSAAGRTSVRVVQFAVERFLNGPNRVAFASSAASATWEVLYRLPGFRAGRRSRVTRLPLIARV